MARKTSPSSRKNRDPLHALVAQLAALKKSGEALGLFVEDRDLLECPGCGLMEDVQANGILITYRGKTSGPDTGLRFAKLRGNRFRCPGCGSILRAP